MSQTRSSLSQMLLLCEVAVRQGGFLFLVGSNRAGHYLNAAIVAFAIFAIAVDTVAGRSQFLWMASVVAATFLLVFWEAFIGQLWYMVAPRNLRFVPRMPFATVAAAAWMLFLVSLAGVGLLFLHEWYFVAPVLLLTVPYIANQRVRYFSIGTVFAGIFGIAVWQLTLGPMSAWMSEQGRSGAMFFFSAWAIALCAFALTGLARIRALWGYPLLFIWLAVLILTPPFNTISVTNTLNFASKGDQVLVGKLSASFDSLSAIAAEFATQSVSHGLAALLACGLLVISLARFQPSTTGQAKRREPKLIATPKISSLIFRDKPVWHWLTGYDSALTRVSSYPTKFSHLLPMTFGRAAHWSSLCWAALFHMAIVFLCFVPPSEKQVMIKVFVMMLMGIALTPFAAMLPSGLIRATFQSRREHRLLSLTPKWPEERALNCELAWHFAKYCGVVVALGLVYILVLSIAYQIEFSSVWRQIVAVLMVGPLLLAAVLRNYTTMPAINLGPEVIGWVMALLLPSVMMTFAYGKLQLPGWAFVAIFAASIALAIWRCKRFLQHSAMLPAGRLAVSAP